MSEAMRLRDAVHEAWADVPAPPREDLRFMKFGWGEEAVDAFRGVAPVAVDVRSAGFRVATPLFDLPPRAAAAYLGTYLIGLLVGVEEQHRAGLCFDIVTRAHTLAALGQPWFWEQVIRPHLAAEQRAVLGDVVRYIAAEPAFLLDARQGDAMIALAEAPPLTAPD